MIGSRLLWTAAFVVLAGIGVLLYPHNSSRVSVDLEEDGESSPLTTGRWRGIGAAEYRGRAVNAVPAELRGLPYLQGYETAPAHSGVTIHDEKRAYPGFNFYTSGHGVEAGIMDMRGNILHRWTHDSEARFKDVPESKDPWSREPFTHWRRARLGEDGELLALYGNILMIKLNRDSAVIWESDAVVPHHHMQVDEDGATYVLTTRERPSPELLARKTVIDDFVTVLDSGGKVVREHSLFEAIRDSDYSWLLGSLQPEGEVFHTNTLDVFDGSLISVSPLFKKGNVLVSMLYLNVIAILNLNENRVVWAMSGQETGLWHGMHEPMLLDNGNMLIFDNNWRPEGVVSKSRVVEFDPLTKKVVWLYEGDEEHPFYSMTCGTVQRLPNGNTLITESDSGRAFEVTPEKKIVWEYISPHRAGKSNELIASLLEVQRVEPDRLRWLIPK